jgi:hypothetical protein
MLVFAAKIAHARGLGLLGLMAAAAVVALLILRLGNRGPVAFLLVPCATLYHYLRRRIPPRVLVLAGFVLLVGFNLLGEYRRAGEFATPEKPVAVERLRPTAALAEHESDRQRFSAMAVAFYTFPDRRDYLYGATWLGLVAMPIPRWLWTSKAEYFVWRDSNIIDELVGQPIPLPYHGTLYANFSWMGVVLGMALWGAVQRGLFEWLQERPKDPSRVLLYANLLLIQAPTVLALQNILLQFVFPIYLILIFIGMRVVWGHGRQATQPAT